MSSVRLAFAVDLLAEARELGRRGADSAERLLVVHANRADEADRAERAVDQPVARSDERDLAQCRMVEILADPHERTLRLVGRFAQNIEERGSLFDELEQV